MSTLKTISIQHPNSSSANIGLGTDGSVSVGTAMTFRPGELNIIGVATATTFSGNITGTAATFTGNISASTFSGNVTGTAATFSGAITAASASFSGNVSIAGTLTYEDVTNVDAIGLVTARSGANITGGNLLVGTSSSTGTASQPLQVTGGAYFSGNVGVGLTNPTLPLHVRGTTAARFDKGDSTQIAQVRLRTNQDSYATEWALGQPANSLNFSIAYNNTSSWNEYLRIDSSGNVLINSTSATGTTSQPLQVTGGAYFSGNVGVGLTNPSTSLHAYRSTSDTNTGRTTPLDVLTIESENTAAVEYEGFGQGLVFRGSTYNNTTQRTLGRILHQINDDSVNTTRGTSFAFQTLDNATTTNAPTTKLLIGPAGQLGIGGANYGTSGQILTSNGSASAPSWQTPAASVDALGAVGAYGFFYYTQGGTLNAGDTTAGSNLRYSNAASSNAGTPSGTWRIHGYSPSAPTSQAYVSLWIRIS